MPKTKRPRDGERFECPHPGCKRSFAELWRLKVHYRAPPDVRGSGKERGHGQELAKCPLCDGKLIPGKHHIQCIGSGGKAAQVARTQSGTTLKSNEGKTRLPRTHSSPVQRAGSHADDKLPHIKADANLNNSLVSNSAHSQSAIQARTAAYNPPHMLQHAASGHTFQRPGSGSLPPLQPHLQHSSLPTAQQQGFSQPHAQHGAHAHTHAQLPHTPWDNQTQNRPGYVLVPMQYTNTFTREAVPGNSGAAHASLQTDLCGYSWPLDVPFPFPTHPAQQHLPSFMAGNAAAQHHVPSAFFVHGSVPHYAQHASMAAHAQTQVQTQAPTQTQHTQHHGVAPSAAEVASATNAPPDIGLHHAHMDAFAAMPASPPSGPPPDLSDMLFDFDRFEGDDDVRTHREHSHGSDRGRGAQGHIEDDELQDIEAVLAMEAQPTSDATDDIMKLFTRDPEDGHTRLTTHLHVAQHL